MGGIKNFYLDVEKIFLKMIEKMLYTKPKMVYIIGEDYFNRTIELNNNILRGEFTMKTNSKFIKTHYGEYINIDCIAKLVIEEPQFKSVSFGVNGYLANGNFFGGWKFETKEEAEAFIENLVTLV